MSIHELKVEGIYRLKIHGLKLLSINNWFLSCSIKDNNTLQYPSFKQYIQKNLQELLSEKWRKIY